MSKAYVIEILNRTVGIVASDEGGLRFFSSERIFDSLEGQEFLSVHDLEQAARVLITQWRPTPARQYRSSQALQTSRKSA
jgi:hypothetical protein